MPNPWLVLLKSVPWVDVVKNAPVVADGARKLWNAVRRPTPVQEAPGAAQELALLPESPGMLRVQARLVTIERAMAELQSEMLASSELIRNLAEQNTQLIARIEANRALIVRLAAAAAALGVIAIALALAR